MGFKDFSLCVCVGGAGPKSAICTPTSPDVALPSPSLYPPPLLSAATDAHAPFAVPLSEHFTGLCRVSRCVCVMCGSWRRGEGAVMAT